VISIPSGEAFVTASPSDVGERGPLVEAMAGASWSELAAALVVGIERLATAAAQMDASAPAATAIATMEEIQGVMFDWENRERRDLERLLEWNEWNIARVARILKVARRPIYLRMKRRIEVRRRRAIEAGPMAPERPIVNPHKRPVEASVCRTHRMRVVEDDNGRVRCPKVGTRSSLPSLPDVHGAGGLDGAGPLIQCPAGAGRMSTAGSQIARPLSSSSPVRIRKSSSGGKPGAPATSCEGGRCYRSKRYTRPKPTAARAVPDRTPIFSSKRALSRLRTWSVRAMEFRI
jgi:hypothetical protein